MTQVTIRSEELGDSVFKGLLSFEQFAEFFFNGVIKLLL